MKKKWICLLLAALCLFSAVALTGCGKTTEVAGKTDDAIKDAQENDITGETPAEEQQQNAVQPEEEPAEPEEPEQHEEPEETEEREEREETEQPGEPEEQEEPEETEQPVEPDEPENPGQLLSLNDEDQYRINVFLSNFAEQSMSDFDAETATEAELLQFAFLHTRLNGGDISFTQDGYARLSLDTVNSKLQRYMGLQLAEPEEGAVFRKWYDITYRDGAFLFPYGDGESYSCMAVAKQVYDKGNGTLQVIFSVYSVVEFSTGGNKIPDSSYYRVTPAQAASDEGYEWIADGEALITPYRTESVDSYQLLKYSLD